MYVTLLLSPSPSLSVAQSLKQPLLHASAPHGFGGMTIGDTRYGGGGGQQGVSFSTWDPYTYKPEATSVVGAPAPFAR